MYSGPIFIYFMTMLGMAEPGTLLYPNREPIAHRRCWKFKHIPPGKLSPYAFEQNKINYTSVCVFLRFINFIKCF